MKIRNFHNININNNILGLVRKKESTMSVLSKPYLFSGFISFAFKRNFSINCTLLKHHQFRHSEKVKRQIRTGVFYSTAAFITMLGLGFAAVPLYTRFCQETNFGGTINTDLSRIKTKDMERKPERELTILFNADKNSHLQWNFKPLQTELKIVPGETVLAFYSAENPTDRTISGISTYNVSPFEAAQYLNKIQCFCFDEQQLNPHEQIDMPVFFYIDPEYVRDPLLRNVGTITLSYTFFEAIEGMNLPFMSRIVPSEEGL